jgi:hypothetical protein
MKKLTYLLPSKIVFRRVCKNCEFTLLTRASFIMCLRKWTFSDTIPPVLRSSLLSEEERSGMALEADQFDACMGQAKHRLLVSPVLKLMA